MAVSRRGFLEGLGLLAGGLAATGPATAAPPAPTTVPPPPPGELPITVTVNGAPIALSVRPEASALSVIREQLGLRGAKFGCGHGACGACTVRVDDAPVCACVLPATSLHGRALGTVEGLGAPGAHHPVQRAFAALDALQCGYCTPGFVVEAAALYDQRKATGLGAPTREEAAAALAGHICRCGAYENILAAVISACRGDYDAAEPEPSRVEAWEKVTGRARYTADVALPGQLVGRFLRAPVAAGTLVWIDVGPALAVPGVRAAVGLAGGGAMIRYVGQPLACVAADDLAAARRGAAAIQWQIAPGVPVIGMEAGRDASRAPVYAEDDPARAKPPNASEGPVIGGAWNGNVRGPSKSHYFANPIAAVRMTDAAAERGERFQATFQVAAQSHTAMEPHGAVADVKDGKITLYVSTQSVDWLAHDLAERFEVDRADVHVIAEHVGGAFGAKAGLEIESVAAVLLSREAKRPVRITLDRAEELLVGGYRPGHALSVAGARSGSAFAAYTAEVYGDGGVAVGNNASLPARMMYPDAAKELLDWDVVTHVAPGRPFRGPGGPPAMFALEQTVDALARMGGDDPLDARRRWDANPARARLYDRLEAWAPWGGRLALPRTGRIRRGVGLAAGVWYYFLDVNTQVSLKATTDGAITVATATQDVGTGVRTVLARAVARVLGVPPATIGVRIGDSRDPSGPLAGGSRSTASIVPAAEHAAEQLRDALLEVAEEIGLVDPAIAEGGVRHAAGHTPWTELLARSAGVDVVGRRRRDKGGYFLPLRFGGLAIGRALTAGLVACEVEVDTRLGRIRVPRVWAGYAVGRIANPAGARSQVHGAVLQGISYALYEEKRLDPTTGQVLTHDLEHYRVALAGDAPETEVVFDEAGFDDVRGGSVGLAELATVPLAGAIGNAVFDATGWRPLELPIRPDRVVAGVAS